MSTTETVSEIQARVDAQNKSTSAAEVAAWLADPPQKYFLYVKQYPNAPQQGNVTTWMGDVLGRCSLGPRVYGWHGSYRRSIRVTGTNGRQYYGWFYESSGDYARVKMVKGGSR